MGDGHKLSVDLEQLRGSAAALRAEAQDSAAALEQISSDRVAAGFAALGELFADVGEAGRAMTETWGAADIALHDRLFGTAQRLGASADLYEGTDSDNADGLTGENATSEGR